MPAESLPKPPSRHRARVVVGLALDARGRSLSAAVLRTNGHASAALFELLAMRRRRLPRTVRQALRHALGHSAQNVGLVAAQLAELQAALVLDLLDRHPKVPSPLVIGAIDPGIWRGDAHSLITCQGLCDPARLGELSGLPVIDGFPLADLAQDGRGGPLAPLPLWMLLRHPQRPRLLVDLGASPRVVALPAGADDLALSGIAAVEIPAGARLLRMLRKRSGSCAPELPDEPSAITPGGDELCEAWLATPELVTEPDWTGASRPGEQWIELAGDRLAERDLPLGDALAAARRFLAETVGRAAERLGWARGERAEIVLCSPRTEVAALRTVLAARLPETRIITPEDLKLPCGLLPAAVAGVLAHLFVDQTPAAIPSITGARKPRVLGQLTPGPPQAWRRLTQELAQTPPAAMSLRSLL